jgi:hypothetical protein
MTVASETFIISKLRTTRHRLHFFVNPSSELARVNSSELDLMAATGIGPWRILDHFYARSSNESSGRAQHDIHLRSSLFGARACCIMGWAVEGA